MSPALTPLAPQIISAQPPQALSNDVPFRIPLCDASGRTYHVVMLGAYEMQGTIVFQHKRLICRSLSRNLHNYIHGEINCISRWRTRSGRGISVIIWLNLRDKRIAIGQDYQWRFLDRCRACCRVNGCTAGLDLEYLVIPAARKRPDRLDL